MIIYDSDDDNDDGAVMKEELINISNDAPDVEYANLDRDDSSVEELRFF